MTSRPYCCPAGIAWTVDRRGVRLVNLASGASQTLTYPAAAIWDLACRNSSSIAEKVAIIAGLPLPDAERLTAETLNVWVRDGFLAEGPQ